MQAKAKESTEVMLKELNQLKAFKSVALTADGMTMINFILDVSHLAYDPYEVSKNSGNTANELGRQKVGRALLDKLIEAGIKIDLSVFSKKNNNRITELTNKINTQLKEK
jgi:hypothetical protein